MKHLKLGAKFMIIGLVLLTVPMMIIGVFTIVESTNRISELTANHLSVISTALADILTVGMGEQLITVKIIAGSETIVSAAERVKARGTSASLPELALADAQLARTKNLIGARCSSINLVGLNGIIVASSSMTNVGGDLSDRDFTQAALRGNPAVGSVVVSKFTGRKIVTAAYPVYSRDGKTILGTLTMGTEIDFLLDLLNNIQIGQTGYATVVDGTGMTITHPNKDLILKENIKDVPGMEPVMERVLRKESGLVEYTRFGVEKLAGLAQVPVTGWTVFAPVERRETYSLAHLLRNEIILISLIAVSLAALSLFFFSRSVTLPLQEIVKAAEGIASGDLPRTVGFTARFDEMGSLSRAFEMMIQSLNRMADLADSIAAGDLTATATPMSERDRLGNAFSAMSFKLRGHLNSISEGTSVLASAGSEILASTTQIVSGTSETASAIGQTTATVEEVRQAAQLSSEKAQNVSDNSQHVNEASESGRKAVEDTSEVMLKIRDQMESITQTIVRLSEQSQSIGGIIASVTELADQSNLLAVNTAIEAARAGEQGKGFAVIAMEIRNLAEQSKQATTQVRSILNEVQKLTGEAVTAVEQGSRAVEAGVTQSTRAGEAIQVLSEASTEAAEAALQIVASSRQQVIGMEQVGLAMANINQAGAQTASSIRQTEIVAQNLHDLGIKLQKLVEQYKT